MDFTDKYTNNSDERIMLRRIADMLRKSEKTYTVLYTGFLTPAQQTLISSADEFYGKISFYGGYDDAERRICRVCADEYASDEGLPAVLFRLTVSSPGAEISHRDILGSLMGAGIKREMIGDIMAHGNEAMFFVCDSVADYIEMNLNKVGRYSAVIEKADAEQLPPPQTRKVTINVSSMRLDSVCGEGFGLSRTKAAEIIKKGLVSVNWLVCDNVSREIVEGDKISMRGKGKISVSAISGVSKKGRLFVDVLKYI